MSFFYLCSCSSTQFLYRTAVKATFNVKDNIKEIIKNSITLTINITTLPTKYRKNWWQNHICLSSFPMLIILQYYFYSVYNIYKFSINKFPSAHLLFFFSIFFINCCTLSLNISFFVNTII